MHKSRDLSKGGRPGWKRRFVSLDWEKSELQYYANHPAVAMHQLGVEEPCKGVIPIGPDTKIEVVEDAPRGAPGRRGVSITSPGRKTILVPPEDTKPMTVSVWCRTLQQAVGEASRSGSDADAAGLIVGATHTRRAEAAVATACASPAHATHPVLSFEGRLSLDGHVWEPVRFALYPQLQLLFWAPTAAPSATTAGSAAGSVGLKGAVVTHRSLPAGAFATTVRDESRSVSFMAPSRRAWETPAAHILAIAARSQQQRSMVEAVPRVLQADGWKANPSNTGWKERRLIVDGHRGLFCYLDPKDALLLRTTDDAERLAKGTVHLSGGEDAPAVGIKPGVLAQQAPAPWGFRVQVGERAYSFAFKLLEDYVEIYGCIELLVRGLRADSD
jgi:hypothetical protein